MATASFRIHGMDCAEETDALRKEMASLPDIRDVAFDLINARMTVTYQAGRLEVADVARAVGRTGMSAETWSVGHPSIQPHQDARNALRTRLTVLSVVLTASGFLVHAVLAGGINALMGHETAPPLLVRFLYLGAIPAGGWFIAPKAWLAARRLRPDMHLLMAIAVVGAVLIGEYLEAAMVTLLFSVSLTLEGWSVSRARRAVTALLELAPPKARVLRDDRSEETVNAEEVAVGSRIVVKPGEKFPLDGQVLRGQTTVNQAPITGESLPVAKSEGSEVFAGTINLDGAVEVITTKLASDTTLARIIRLVGEAQSRRAPSEQWVERFARIYTPLALSTSFLVAFVPPLALERAWTPWLYQALVLLVIACPCALVISTPVTIVAAMVCAARQGVLIKGGIYVELPGRLKAIALDKTGTLTVGRPQATRIVPLSGHTEKELLEIAAAVEKRSQHPLAEAIVRESAARDLNPAPAADFQAVTGKGATATVDGRQIWIGSHRLLEERGQETPEMHDQLEGLSAAGASVVVVGKQEHVCGFIAIADEVRPNARETVAELKSLGIESVVMLTGDNRGTAEAVGHRTGIDEIHAELMPESKVQMVERLVARWGTVAMVGDGVNDAPALARANVGIAMGAIGTDAAIETADIALMTDDLSRLPWLIRHSRRALRIIRANIAASLTVKAVFVVLTLIGKGSLWAAIAADTGMSLLVVLNSLRLLRAQDSPGAPNHA